MDTLKQTKNFVKREVRISDSKFYYNISKFGNADEIDIPYENLNGEKVSHKTSLNFLLFLSVIIYLISIATFIRKSIGANVEQNAYIFWAVIATIILGFYWFTRADYWKINLIDNHYIYIHKNIPNKTTTDNFLKNLMASRNEFLKENYFFIDENLEYQNQLNNFQWLKSIEVISKEEFDKKYSELKRTVKPNKTNIGFVK